MGIGHTFLLKVQQRWLITRRTPQSSLSLFFPCKGCNVTTSIKSSYKFEGRCLFVPRFLVPNSFSFFSLLTDIVVELDEHSKTPALVLSADRLEVSNPNWTFESVRATLCVGRAMCAVPPYPAGWYYEVTLKSTGILQIGMWMRLSS